MDVYKRSFINIILFQFYTNEDIALAIMDSNIEVKHLSIGRVCDGFSRFYSATFFPWVQNYVSIVNTSEGIFSRISGLENAQSLQSFLMRMNIWWQDASTIKRGSIITVLSSDSIIRSVVPMESYLNKKELSGRELDYSEEYCYQRSRFVHFPRWKLHRCVVDNLSVPVDIGLELRSCYNGSLESLESLTIESQPMISIDIPPRKEHRI